MKEKKWNSRLIISIFVVGKDEGLEGQQWIDRDSLPSIGQIYGTIEGMTIILSKLDFYRVC